MGGDSRRRREVAEQRGEEWPPPKAEPTAIEATFPTFHKAMQAMQDGRPERAQRLLRKFQDQQAKVFAEHPEMNEPAEGQERVRFDFAELPHVKPDASVLAPAAPRTEEVKRVGRGVMEATGLALLAQQSEKK